MIGNRFSTRLKLEGTDKTTRQMATELELAYAHCERITKAEARNFSYAFRTLPPLKRRAIHAAYAFCRLCDDVADGDETSDEKRRQFAEIRDHIRNRLNGDGADPVFVALKDTIDSFDMHGDYLEEIVDGVEMDLAVTRYQSFDELREYCYKVASVVGLVSIKVFGYEQPVAEDHAVDLGLAMQLTNIVRDLREDAARGRIYLPLDEVYRFGYSERELQEGVVNDAFRALMRFQIARAREYFDKGKQLFPLLPPQSRACPAVLHAVYSAILDRIEAADFDVFQRRIGLTSRQKWLLMARLWATSLLPAAYPLRR